MPLPPKLFHPKFSSSQLMVILSFPFFTSKTLALPATLFFLLHFIFNLSAKLFFPNFRLYPDSNLFSPPPLLLPWAKPWFPLSWIIAETYGGLSGFHLCPLQSILHTAGRMVRWKSQSRHSSVQNPPRFHISLRVRIKILTWALHNASSPCPHYLCDSFFYSLLCSPFYVHTGLLAVRSKTDTIPCVLALALPRKLFSRYLHPQSFKSLLRYCLFSEGGLTWPLYWFLISRSSRHFTSPLYPALLFAAAFVAF